MVHRLLVTRQRIAGVQLRRLAVQLNKILTAAHIVNQVLFGLELAA